MMLLCEPWVFDDAAGEISALASALERKAAGREAYEAAAVWRDIANLFVLLDFCNRQGEGLEPDEVRHQYAHDVLVHSAIELGGLVRCHLVDRKRGEVVYLFGEDCRLDFHLDKGEIDELNKLKIFQ